ncbi:DUF418 domain-containing protein [Phaeocystidibacter luteus]|uniref:DUF418 domain-containing protein n=1 Tax=Phaeocystidibacter luteus TaxID=911197 RepID=A0A6N6RKE0_9FLAO|nr:DUF418 domain-containing protein [Phaeocystidibacter luteus]KAB2809976.1 DUF418 domain-containing protein [Phaeocystidibacter luteus]
MGRIHELDFVRGFALCGIILVNIFVFHAPYAYYGEFYFSFPPDQIHYLEWMNFTSAGKFMFIYSFLFGIGIAMQFSKKGAQFPVYHSKRMAVLMLFGAIHILGFWLGDILFSYGLLGLLILPFLKLKRGVLVAIGLLFLYFRPLYAVGMVYFDFPAAHGTIQTDLDGFLEVFQNGSYGEVFRLRMAEFEWFIPENLVMYVSKSFGLFFLGFAFAKRGLRSAVANIGLKHYVVASIVIAGCLVFLYNRSDFFGSFDLDAEPGWRPILISLNVTVETLQAVAYMILAVGVYRLTPLFGKLIGDTGRMALTNYFIQSILSVGIFYSYGLGFYGKLQPSTTILIAFGIYAFNILFSALWLSRHEQGPLEYVWRKVIRKE